MKRLIEWLNKSTANKVLAVIAGLFVMATFSPAFSVPQTPVSPVQVQEAKGPVKTEPPPAPVAQTPEPTPAAAAPTVPTPEPTPVDTPTPAPTPTSSSTYYANCTAARNAGAAPIYAGQPGYRSALDRDGDGVACE